MSNNTQISWTNATLNPYYGCNKVSQGCKNCYAIDVVAGLARKFRGTKYGDFYDGLAKDGNWTGVVKVHKEHLFQPLSWGQPKKIFVNALSDVFHNVLTDEQIEELFVMMAVAYWHTFQIITKRPARMKKLLSDPSFAERVALGAALVNGSDKYKHNKKLYKNHPGISWPLPNVWLGVSVEDQKAADERIPLLVQTPAAVRFLSCEPLLGPVDLRDWLGRYPLWSYFLGPCKHGRDPWTRCEEGCDYATGVDWVIVGGESGPNYRPLDMSWARSLRDQCVSAKVAFFFKQDSDRRAGQRPYLVELDGTRKTYQEFPEASK